MGTEREAREEEEVDDFAPAPVVPIVGVAEVVEVVVELPFAATVTEGLEEEDVSGALIGSMGSAWMLINSSASPGCVERDSVINLQIEMRR